MLDIRRTRESEIQAEIWGRHPSVVIASQVGGLMLGSGAHKGTSFASGG